MSQPTEPNIELLSRYRGSLTGLAVGDALGTTIEFCRPGQFEPVKDMVGGGPFNLEAGHWTDDTSMALCLAESLIECAGFDANDQMRRYLRWYREGHLSSAGHCFDVGNTVSAALRRFELSGNPFEGETDAHFGGNGSLMRLAPIPLGFAQDPLAAIQMAAEMSRTTHAAPEPVDACRYYTGLIIGALQGTSKEVLLSPHYAPALVLWEKAPLSPRIDEVAAGTFKVKNPPEIRGTGYVVDALEAALWSFWHTDSFEAGALKAVNLGDDADTTGAIYGQLAGAFYGYEAIPEHWRQRIALANRILQFAEGLLVFAQAMSVSPQKNLSVLPCIRI